MNSRPIIEWLRRGLIVSGAPLLAHCPPFFGNSTCGKIVSTQPWDGKLLDGGTVSDGYLDYETCNALCNGTSCDIVDAGLVECRNVCIGGRLPPGQMQLSAESHTAAAWVARMAELETAAVFAFTQLADELETHGLHAHARHALQAAADEARHAQAVTSLALRLGRCPAPREVVPTPVRSLEALALDNASEGCGRELFGAMINAHQAQHAADPWVRSTMAGIAGDELQHARFSFELAAALGPKLSVAARRRMRAAQAQALEHLGDDQVPAPLQRELGLMNGEQLDATARQLLETWRLS